MADQDNLSWSGIAAKYLPDIIGSLGSAGLAKGAAAAASKGMFLTPAQFKRALKQNPNMEKMPLHPAVWNTLPEKDKAFIGNPSSQDARLLQSTLDSDVMKNSDTWANKKNLFPYTGWSMSPTMGLVREIPDIGSTISKVGSNEAVLQHPYVDLHKLYKVPNIKLNPELEPGNANYYWDRSIDTSPNPSTSDILHEFTHAGQRDSGNLFPDTEYGVINTSIHKDPANWSQQDLRAVSQPWGRDPSVVLNYLKRSHAQGNTENIDHYLDKLNYMRQAPETEAYNVESRFNNPDLYKQSPESTQYFTNDQLLYGSSQP